MKKICYIATVAKSIEWFMLDDAIYMQKQGYDVFLICNNKIKFEVPIPEGMKIININMKRGISIFGFLSIIILFKIFKRNKFDIIQYTTANASLYSSIAGFFAKIKVRLYRQWGIRFTGFTGFKRKVFVVIEKIICKFSTYITPDSFSNYELSLKNNLYNNKKAEVILSGSANGVNLEKFNIKNKEKWNQESRLELEISSNEYVFGFIGRIVKDKGIVELYNAFTKIKSIVPESKLLLVGYLDAGHNLSEEFVARIENSKDIIITGYKTEVEKYLSVMDVLILPSYREGFGKVIIESYAMKVPVIATNINGPKDVVKNMQTGLLVSPKNTENIYDALNIVYRDIEVRDNIVNNAFRYVKENYDMIDYNKANFKLYKKLFKEE